METVGLVVWMLLVVVWTLWTAYMVYGVLQIPKQLDRIIELLEKRT